jgi:hypothetical protein
VTAVGTPTDAHELHRLANGNYVLLSYPQESHVDLTGLQSLGNDETIEDCEIQEIDPTGNLVWSWIATDHVDPVQESLVQNVTTGNGKTVVDVFHCNSIDADADGNLLLSIRHASAAVYIERATGTVLWKLGGSATNKDGATNVQIVSDPQTTFSKQHDVRFLDPSHITMFDNHGGGPAGSARGVEYELDFRTNQATPVWQFLGSGQSQYTGSFRRFPDGESVISWGYIPGDTRVVTEVDAIGKVVLEISIDSSSYRGLKVAKSQLDIALMRATASASVLP